MRTNICHLSVSLLFIKVSQWICFYPQIFYFCSSFWTRRGRWSVWGTCRHLCPACCAAGEAPATWSSAWPRAADPCWWTSSATAAAPGGPTSSGSRWGSCRPGSATRRLCQGTRPAGRGVSGQRECCRSRQSELRPTWEGRQDRLCQLPRTRPAQISSTGAQIEDAPTDTAPTLRPAGTAGLWLMGCLVFTARPDEFLLSSVTQSTDSMSSRVGCSVSKLYLRPPTLLRSATLLRVMLPRDNTCPA